MKFAIVFAALFAVGFAALLPSNPDRDAYTVLYNNDNIGIGPYNVNVETSNGQKKSESAELRKVNPDADSIAVRGSYSYVGPDGVTYTVNYVADENGYRAEGAHLPVGPN